MAQDVDYYQIEELLSEEERMVRDVARRFVEEEFLPRVQRCFREGSFPADLIPRLGQLGFLGMTLPTQYGCAGLNNIAYGLVSQELERGDSGLRSFASVQSSLVMYPVYSFGSEAR
jgi:glutaryl-CoA dehydrogenase